MFTDLGINKKTIMTQRRSNQEKLQIQMDKYIHILKVITIVVLLFATSVGAKSQVHKEYKKIHNMYVAVHIADSFYSAKDYENAIKFYKKSKDAYYYKAIILSNIVICYLGMEDTLTAMKYSKKPPTIEKNVNEELRAEFLKRKITDQMYRGLAHSDSHDSLWEIQKEYDRENQLFLDSIIDKYGWPGISLLDNDGANAAFLIAQHADLNLKFQEKCLKSMKKAFIKNDVFRPNFAYLMDRVMLRKYDFQLFGSQCMEIDGIFQPRPLYDERIVVTLRKYFWMNPLEEYLEFMQKRHGKNEQNKN